MNEIYIKHLDWSGICILDENKIYRKNFPDETGTYKLYENRLIIYWEKWEKEDFYYQNSIYYSKKLLNINIKPILYNKNMLYIIYPNNLFIEDKLIFSNITLSEKKIILTSNYYLENQWNISNLKINLFNTDENMKKPISYTQNIYENSSNIETIFSIILDLDEYYDKVIIEIIYSLINNDSPQLLSEQSLPKLFNKSFFLEQINIKPNTLSAMTLFKDDYPLLKQYIKYYHSLGIDLFFLYYNSKITAEFLLEIKGMLSFFTEVKIYLTEWNYPYFIPTNNSIFNKQHHSQTMAINDSLHILKNNVKYTLYNDLDEYIILENYKSFKELVNDIQVDVYLFKNQFCKMGNELIKYKNFYDLFDLSKIIYGNYWQEKREKNLIKLEYINCMGVHFAYKNNLNIKYISKFCHFINFEEKNREELMTEFVIHL